jgi:glycosyltransferase involved in cell wall biosynthesis
MRIAIFSETFLPGTDGVVTHLCGTLKHLSESGHDVLLFAPHGAPPTYAFATIIGIPSFRFFLYPEKKFALPFPRGGKVLKEFQPDLIHAVNPGFLGFAAIYYARRYRVPLIASYHTHIPKYARYYRLPWLEPFLWWCFRAIHNRAEINLCPSSATIVELESRGFRNLALWERGVDLQMFSPAKRSEQMRTRLLNHHKDDDQKLLLYVGRLAKEKEIEKLRPCLDRMPDIHLAIVGDGPYRSTLESIFAGTNTVFTGYLFGEELAQAYASADGFVFTSTIETLGLVLYEAMASGLPVMAANSPATQEVLEHGRIGFIFDPEDFDSMLEALNGLLYDEKQRKRVQAWAEDIVCTLDWSKPTEQLLSHYQRLLVTRAANQPEPIQDSTS